MEQFTSPDRSYLDLSLRLDLRAFLQRGKPWVIPLILLVLGGEIDCSRSTTFICTEGDGNAIEVIAEPASSPQEHSPEAQGSILSVRGLGDAAL